MLQLLKRKVPLAWLLIIVILASAVFVLGKLVIVDAPPRNAVLIQPAATRAIASTAVPSKVALLAPSSPTREAIPSTEVTEQPAPTQTPEPSPTPERVVIYVSGAVQQPGVYTLTLGSRVADVIEQAGGLLPEADTARINLAERVADEEHIVVPRNGESNAVIAGALPTRTPARATPTRARASSPPSATPAPAQPTGKININTASAAQMEALPGIGPSLSQRIVTYRDAHGPFATIEDIMLVPGIKDGLFAKVRDLITVGP